MEIKWVDRDGSNKVITVYGTKQFEGQEQLDETHPDIVAFFNPPPPTDEERIDAAFPQTDTARVIFEALFELINRVIVLEAGTAVDRAQLKTWLKNKLP